MPANMRKHNKTNEVQDAVVIEGNPNNSHAANNRIKNRKIEENKETIKVKAMEKQKGKTAKMTEIVQFTEEEDEVAMEVQGDITSKGEIKSDSELDKYESENEAEDRLVIENSDTERSQESSQNSSDEEELEQQRKDKLKRKEERQDRRASMEQKLDSLRSKLEAMQEMFMSGRSYETSHRETEPKARSDRGKSNADNESETTIYHNAVPRQQHEVVEQVMPSYEMKEN